MRQVLAVKRSSGREIQLKSLKLKRIQYVIFKKNRLRQKA